MAEPIYTYHHEANGLISFSVYPEATYGLVTVNFVDGTAIYGEDYIASYTQGIGATPIEFTIINDDIFEEEEFFTIVTTHDLGEPGIFTGNIIVVISDDDEPDCDPIALQNKIDNLGNLKTDYIQAGIQVEGIGDQIMFLEEAQGWEVTAGVWAAVPAAFSLPLGQLSIGAQISATIASIGIDLVRAAGWDDVVLTFGQQLGKIADAMGKDIAADAAGDLTGKLMGNALESFGFIAENFGSVLNLYDAYNNYDTYGDRIDGLEADLAELTQERDILAEDISALEQEIENCSLDVSGAQFDFG